MTDRLELAERVEKGRWRMEGIHNRLERWRECVRTGQPTWLAPFAPLIVEELEAALRASHSQSS